MNERTTTDHASIRPRRKRASPFLKAPWSLCLLCALGFWSAGTGQDLPGPSTRPAPEPTTATSPASDPATQTRPATTTTSVAGEGGKPQPSTPTVVRFRRIQLLSHDKETVVIRASLELSGAANRWYGVYFTLGSEAPEANAATRPVAREMQKLWNNLFMPDEAKAGWSDIRLAFVLADIESVLKPPAGARTVFWVRCGIWDYDAQKYVEGGRDSWTQVILTTDKTGKIVNVETSGTDSPPSGTGVPPVGADHVGQTPTPLPGNRNTPAFPPRLRGSGRDV